MSTEQTEASVRRSTEEVYYVFDQAWQQEHDRLDSMARLWDPGTFALLDRLGVGPGWMCLEIGPGAGSVSKWLAERVGANGRVLAADIDPRHVQPLAGGPLEVASIDVLHDDLEPKAFDLVYARTVAGHLGAEAVRGMGLAVKPGGVLCLEDYDTSSIGCYPVDEDFARGMQAALDFMSRAGLDPHFGLRLPFELRAAGLTDVRMESRVRVWAGGTPDADFFRLSLSALSGRLVKSGAIDEAGSTRAAAAIEDQQRTFLGPTMVAAWGRAPGR